MTTKDRRSNYEAATANGGGVTQDDDAKLAASGSRPVNVTDRKEMTRRTAPIPGEGATAVPSTTENLDNRGPTVVDGKTVDGTEPKVDIWLARARQLTARKPFFIDLVALGGLTGVLAFLWGRGRGVWFWIDEGIAVGISSQPLTSIPGLLRQDGAPPLYYLLLHLWMSVFGSSEAATHFLSLLFALAVVPAALWAGWSLFGRRAGWICAVLAALNPFLSYYANETRMYSLLVLLGLLTIATFVHVFVFGHRRYLPAFVVLLTLSMYTHNWSLFLAVGAGLAVIPCAVTRPDPRRTLIDAVFAFSATGLLYAPWLPMALYQAGQGLNPWARRATLSDMREQVAILVGGREVVIALGVGAAGALVTILKRPTRRDALAVVALVIMAVVIVMGGWVSGVWAYRYLALIVPFLLLVLALGLARGGGLAVAAIVVTAFLMAPVGVKVPPFRKSNAKAVAEEATGSLQRGDLVISPDFTQVPLLSYYLPAGLRYAGPGGLVAHDYITDWRHSLERMRDSRPADAIPPLVDALPTGGRVLLMCPDIDATSLELVEFHELAYDRCQEIRGLLASDDRLDVEWAIEDPQGIEFTPFESILLRKGP